jgi:FkbM family methyltransferase
MKKIKNFLSFQTKYLKLSFKKIILKLLMPNVNEVLVRTQFGKMLIDPLDNNVSRQLIKSGNYNPEEVSSIKKLLKKSDSLLICGAHIGSLAIPLAHHVRKITAIEASPENYNLLDLNITINRCKNIFAFNFAAGETAGNIEFVMSKENSGGSKRKPVIRRNNYYYDHPKIIKVKSFSLDKKFKENFDIVIMDIEVSEFFAMSGMLRILKNTRIFIFEFIPDHLANVAGVTVKDFISKIPTSNFNYAFFPRQKIYVGIDKLEYTLNWNVENKSYEDGVILS